MPTKSRSRRSPKKLARRMKPTRHLSMSGDVSKKSVLNQPRAKNAASITNHDPGNWLVKKYASRTSYTPPDLSCASADRCDRTARTRRAVAPKQQPTPRNLTYSVDGIC